MPTAHRATRNCSHVGILWHGQRIFFGVCTRIVVTAFVPRACVLQSKHYDVVLGLASVNRLLLSGCFLILLPGSSFDCLAKASEISNLGEVGEA